MTTDQEKVYGGLLHCIKLALMYETVLRSSRLITDLIVPVMAVQQESVTIIQTLLIFSLFPRSGLPITPFVPTFLNNKLKYPPVIASDW